MAIESDDLRSSRDKPIFVHTDFDIPPYSQNGNALLISTTDLLNMTETTVLNLCNDRNDLDSSIIVTDDQVDIHEVMEGLIKKWTSIRSKM